MFKEQLRSVGEAIRKARQYRGLTQTELATMIETSPKTISAIEVGRVEPSISQMQAIAAALHEPIGVFLADPGSTMQSKIEHIASELADIRKLIKTLESKKAKK